MENSLYSAHGDRHPEGQDENHVCHRNVGWNEKFKLFNLK